ncbi:hypothetical protein [Capillimicrobium parvum]|uniref:hypothetical protein n=1 Tax=Capillimicrobium parvum TaxID=2884022 RepID=UPI00216B1476|nr:hypothetical protein [Capillimicrobium parvum]
MIDLDDGATPTGLLHLRYPATVWLHVEDLTERHWDLLGDGPQMIWTRDLDTPAAPRRRTADRGPGPPPR